MEKLYEKQTESLSEALGILPGVVALVGGGGKTSVMLRLARELSRRGRVIVTTTTHIWPPQDMPVLLDPYCAEIAAKLRAVPLLCVGSPGEDDKLCACGVSTDMLSALADYVLVEADGAKRLPLKAPDAHEPAIPVCANQVIAVAGLDGIGKPIADTAFRPALYADVLNTDVSHIITPKDLAAVLTSPLGQRKGVHAATRFSVVLNKADDDARLTLAEEVLLSIDRALTAHVAVTGLIGGNERIFAAV